MSDSAHGHDTQAEIRTYLAIFAALTFLTILTVGVAYMNLPHGPGIVVALLIAMAKIFLIAAFFMHLRHEGRLIKVSLGVCLGLVMILIVFVLPDLGVHELEVLEREHKASHNPYLPLQHEAGHDESADVGGH